MIIGISGKIGSGKDTIGKIIQYLVWNKSGKETFEDFCEIYKNIDIYTHQQIAAKSLSGWEIKKYASKLKQIVSILTGYSIEDLEKEEVKNTKLKEAWTKYGYADGFTKDNNGNTTMLSVPCSKERYEKELAINWQTSYKKEYTVRKLLQEVGTDAMRNIIHPNIWVNALFVDYKLDNGVVVEPINEENKNKYPIGFAPSKQQYFKEPQYPNWIITDVRFPNELQAVKNRGGISIRVNRPNREIDGETYFNLKSNNSHSSETALDDAKFNYIINNNSSIEELIKKVKSILINEKII